MTKGSKPAQSGSQSRGGTSETVRRSGAQGQNAGAGGQAMQKDVPQAAAQLRADQQSDQSLFTGPANTSQAIEMLKADHRKVEAMLEQVERSDDEERQGMIVREICSSLIVHMSLEEEIFYPACRDVGVDAETMDQSQVEHDSAKILINELLLARPGSPYWKAKVAVLGEQIKHHVEDEEAEGEGVFALALSHGIEDQKIYPEMMQRKEQLQRRAAGIRYLRAESFQSHRNQEDDMPRYGTPERDERGRFMSDDDRAYGRSRSRYDDDDDYRRGGGRGWYGDPEGHAEAGRMSHGGRGGRYRYEDDDDRSYRSRSRYEDDEDRRGGRSQGGWSGDPEGHSEASRRGWENRGGGRSRYEDDERGSYRSRYGEDDDGRSSRGGRGHGGWYGDPEGHAEASRQGWEHRGGGRSRYDDDERGSARSRYRDDDDGRSGRGGRGHGGWFGDSEGHSEAARRGWERR